MRQGLIQICTLLAVLLLPAVAQAQFSFTTNNGALTVSKYTGSGGAVTIPSMTNGLPITDIDGSKGVFGDSAVTSVTIPNSVTNIGQFAFTSCIKLTNISFQTALFLWGARRLVFARA